MDIRDDNIHNGSEDDGNILNASEEFGILPNDSEAFRDAQHSLTVREVQRLFEEKGVSITERSITNYCKMNRDGVSLLDSFFDTNERRHYITVESVEKAIEEVRERKIRMNQFGQNTGMSSRSESNRNDSESIPKVDLDDVKTLQAEVLDLTITNKGKDYLIDQLKNERQGFIKQLQDDAHKIGKLETELLLLAPPKEDSGTDGRREHF